MFKQVTLWFGEVWPWILLFVGPTILLIIILEILLRIEEEMEIKKLEREVKNG